MSKRLLFVTSRLPWPANSGRKVSLYHYCRGLSEKYGYEIALFVFPEWDQPRTPEGTPPFVREVRFAAPIGALTKGANLVGRAGLCGEPLQCALYYSRKNRRLLRAFVNDFAPDVMLFDMIRLAPYMKDFCGKVRCLLDLDDLLSVRYARQLAAFDNRAGIAGRYAGGMNRFAEKLLCHGRLGRLILGSEQKRLQRAEIRYANAADGVILVSEKETARLNARLKKPLAVTVPTGVDMAAFDAVSPKKSPRTMGLVGNFSVAANLASLEGIVRDILPHLKRPYRFEVVGAVPDEVRARFAAVENLVFLGEVEELARVMKTWQLSLCPIAFGTGLKTKILEAMAAALPVLTNGVGAEGINATHGREIFVLNDQKALASTANALLDDPVLCREVGEAARAFAAAHFSWEHAFGAFKNLDL